MLCDASGDIASLELSSTRSHMPASPGRRCVVHTNAFSSDRIREVQIPWNAVYTDHAPTPLRGRRLHQSSQLRDQRFTELLGRSEPLGVNELGAIMADHGPTGTPDNNTPCIHSGTGTPRRACNSFRSRDVSACHIPMPVRPGIRTRNSNAIQADIPGVRSPAPPLRYVSGWHPFVSDHYLTQNRLTLSPTASAPYAESRRCGSRRLQPAYRCGRWPRSGSVRRSAFWR